MAMRTKTITTDWRYSRAWIACGFVLGFGNLAVAIYNMAQGESSGVVLFNGALGGYLIGKLSERTGW